MNSLITHGIKITVQTKYDSEGSKPSQGRFIHAYHIVIENLSSKTVQLLKRRWNITSSSGITRIIEGDGVVGQQPILEPFDIHEYTSWCPLTTTLGKMKGAFLMQDIKSHDTFEITVPEFQLIADFVNN